MTCLRFKHQTWNLIPKTHQYQRMRHFSHWMPFECTLSFRTQGWIQKGTCEECECWNLKWECWVLPHSCLLIMGIFKAKFSQFQLLKHSPICISDIVGRAIMTPNADLGSKCFYTSLLSCVQWTRCENALKTFSFPWSAEEDVLILYTRQISQLWWWI